MKKTYRNIVFLIVPIFIFLIFPSRCIAEKVYYKDGKVSSEKIIYRNRGVVWYKKSTGLAGINIKDIDRIENDDGTISKYDYKTIGREIQGSIKESKYNDAIILCSTLLETIPDNARIHYLRGILSQKTGDFGQARQDYDFLVKNKLADAAILNNLGAIYATDQKYKEAADLFIKAAAENPDMAEVHDNLAQASLVTSDYSRAASEYEKVIQQEPDNVNALYNLGIIYMSKGEYQKAKGLWERVLAIKPEDSDTKKALEYLTVKREQ